MSDQIKKKDKTVKKPKAVKPAQPPAAGTLQQMQPMFNQAIFHKGNKKLDMSGNLRDTNAPTGLDWLEKFGPNRPEVAERRSALGRELRPDGGIQQMAERGRGAVEAQKATQAMLPKIEPPVKSFWGDDKIGAVNMATKNGVPVGFSTQTPNGNILHQFSPKDVQSMLDLTRSPSQKTPELSGAMPFFGGGAETVPGSNPQALHARDLAGIKAREAGRQKRQNEFNQPIGFFDPLMQFGQAIGDQFQSGGEQQGNMIADLFGYSNRLPAIKPAEVPIAVGPPQSAQGIQPAAKRMFETFVPTAGLLEAGVKAGTDWLSGLFEPKRLPPIRPDELLRSRQPVLR